MGQEKNGRAGDDVVIPVPRGTLVVDAESGETLADLTDPGERFLLARGGRGGRGNARFATSTDRAPRRAEPGGPGEKRTVHLELKLLADAGLVGLPNAGKSTLLARVTAARPKIADYPFTTLAPNLGLVRVGAADSFLLADIPGLIEGASEGKGLGHDFLRHVERCRVLLVLIDAVSETPEEDHRVLLGELEKYRPELLERPRLLVWNKMDAAGDPESLPRLAPEEWRISAATGDGVEELLWAALRAIREERDGDEDEGLGDPPRGEGDRGEPETEAD